MPNVHETCKNSTVEPITQLHPSLNENLYRVQQSAARQCILSTILAQPLYVVSRHNNTTRHNNNNNNNSRIWHAMTCVRSCCRTNQDCEQSILRFDPASAAAGFIDTPFEMHAWIDNANFCHAIMRRLQVEWPACSVHPTGPITCGNQARGWGSLRTSCRS